MVVELAGVIAITAVESRISAADGLTCSDWPATP
jgi:hypothetical protein